MIGTCLRSHFEVEGCCRTGKAALSQFEMHIPAAPRWLHPTGYSYPEDTPTQAQLNPEERGELIVYPRYAAALEGLADFEYAQLITMLDRVPEGSSVALPRSEGSSRTGRT
jgi:hypothetical protein